MNKNVYIETLGCQMNKSDSERIFGILSQCGYSKCDDSKNADLLIVNTCNIRQLSADKAYSLLGKWCQRKKEHPDIKIAICGCVAQQDKELVFKRLRGVDLVFGTHNIYELPDLIKKVNDGEKVCAIRKEPYKANALDYPIERAEGVNAWLPIIEGCDYFCTYCVVPYVRGRQRSRMPEEILEEAKRIVAQGYKEITLLGQTVDSYGRDIDDDSVNLSNLLCSLHSLDGLLRIRFVTSYPTDISDELIQTVKELDKVCEYFHIPMQSGNDEVLKNMRRRYTRAQYLEICKKLRSAMPDVSITSDFIVGFPGETQEQFEDTLSIIDEAGLDYSNTASYSPRRQTPAATWRDRFIDEKTKKERLAILNQKVKDYSLYSNQKCVGKVMDILVESSKIEDGKVVVSGRTRSNKVVHAQGDDSMIGTIVNVKIEEASTWCLKGKIV